MTVFEGIELDIPTRNRVKDSIKFNDPLDDVLHVIMVVSNPCNYFRRYQLARQFILRMENEEHIKLYIVELCYLKQPFVLTKKNNPHHIQLRTKSPIWHKENMINIGTTLFPSNWKAMAWIDADIEFESNTWAKDTLKILNGYADMVQLFSHAVDLDKDETTMHVANSGGYQYEKQLSYRMGINYWHPGYAWACTRKAYETMGGLYENAILGSGDQIMMMALLGQVEKALNPNNHEEYKKDALLFQERVKQIRFSYVPGVIRHYFHGTKANRRYRERWQILVDHKYNPQEHLKKEKNGLLVPSSACPPKLLEDILQYFKDRNEDD
jgi:hypothetical protein